MVAAWAPEFAALRRHVPSHVVLRVVGVGLVEAALGTAGAVAEVDPRAVVLIGTAGVYPGALQAAPVGLPVLVRRMRLLDGGVARGEAYLPEPMPANATSTARLTTALAGSTAMAMVDAACPLAITRTTAAARRAARASGASVENLECFAVARAASIARVPFACVVGISNVVGPAAHAQWKANAGSAVASAANALLAWLRGAPGRRVRG